MSDESLARTSIRRGTKFRWSIGVKLTVVFLTLVLIPMSFVAYYNLTYAQTAVESIADENLTELSRSTSHHIGLLLTENQRTSATMAGDPMVIEFLAASEEERQNLTPQLYQTLQNFADTHPDYDAPGILDVDGIVVASLAEELVGKNRSFRDYFQASIEGESYISDMLVGRGTGRPGVFLTNPVVTADDEIVGINIVWLKADAIWSIIDEVEVGLEGFAYLVDPDGVVIAHPQRDLLYHSLGNLSPEAITTINETIRFGTVEGTDVPLIPESLGMEDLASELALAQGSGTCRHCSTLDNRSHVVGYARIEQQSWTVVVDLPEDQYLAPLRYLEWIAWLSVGVVGACTFIISILLVHSIVKPIRRLTGAAIAVERNQSFELPDIEDVTSGRDEIACLGHVFSSMVLSLRQEISDRKRAEEKLKEYSDQLEEIVEERTKNLATANQELEAFAYSVSHDLRSPLRGIAGFSKAVLEDYSDLLDETGCDYLRRMHEGAVRMSELIADILSLSRVSREEMHSETIDMTALARIIAGELRRQEPERKVKLMISDNLSAYGDRRLMYLVLENLLRNAWKFTSKHPSAKIEFGATEQKKETVFFLRDNGAGFDMRYVDKMFNAFQRLHHADEFEGTGVGLAIAKRIISRHGGRIWAEGELGTGATIYFALPSEGSEV